MIKTICVWASTCNEFWFSLWEVCLGLRWTGQRVKNGVATQIRFRNHKYSVLVKGLICTRALVWSLGMGMGRCQGPNHPLPPRPFTHCVPNPNPIKGFSNRLSKLTHTHTHTHMHLNIQHVILSQNLNIHLPWHSFKITRRQQRYHKVVASTKHNQAYSITQAQHHGIKQNFQV